MTTTEKIKCPHCGSAHEMSKADYMQLYASDNGSYVFDEQCVQCEQAFIVNLEVWITLDVKPNDDNTHQYSN